jgi:hypothetical protein
MTGPTRQPKSIAARVNRVLLVLVTAVIALSMTLGSAI